MRLVSIFSTLTVLLVMISGCDLASNDTANITEKPVIQLRFGHDMPEQSPQHRAAVKFAERVREQSNGELKVNIFAGQQLGSDRQMVAMAQAGELDITLPPTAKLSHLIPTLQVLDLPYLFPSPEAAYNVLDSKSGRNLLAQFNEHGLIGITFWESGFKQLTSSQPIVKFEDFKALKFRIMESNLLRDQFAAWGSQSVAIDFGKTYDVLKNNVVDGQENPLNSIVNLNLHQVQNHLYLSNHGYLTQVFVLSAASMSKLSKRHQEILIDAAKDTTQWQRKQAQKKHLKLLEQLQQHPIKISPLPPEVEKQMQAKAQILLERYRFTFGTELIESILQTIDEQRSFTDDQLVIAIDADMSGNSALSGLAIKRGIELAVDEVNQNGGLLGKQLVVIARDNSMIPARGLNNLNRFVQLPNLLAIFSGISSPVVLAELEYIHQNKMLMLDPWAAATPIIDNGYKPNYVFRVSVRDQFAAEFLLENALKVSNRVGLLLVDNGWGRSNHKALTGALENLGLTPATTEWFEWGKTDFSATVNKLYQSGSEVVIYVGNPIEAAKVVQQLSKKQSPLPVISHWGITGGYFPKLAGDALKKVDLRILQTFSFIDNNKPNVVDFVERYKAKYAIEKTAQIVAPVGTAHAYDLTHLLVKAVRKAGSSDPSEVRIALETLESHTGLVKHYAPPFTPDNHDALDRSDFILTRYEDNYLVPYKNP